MHTRFILSETNFASRDIEDLLTNVCWSEPKIRGRSPRKVVYDIAEGCRLAFNSLGGPAREFSKYKVLGQYRYLLERYLDWLELEADSAQRLRLIKYFEKIMRGVSRSFYPIKTIKKTKIGEAPSIRNISLYSDFLYRIYVYLKDDTIIIEDSYLNEVSDDYTSIIIPSEYIRKLYFRLGKHSTYRWHPGTDIRTLILYKLKEQIGLGTGGAPGNRNAWRDAKVLLAKLKIPYKENSRMWRYNSNDDGGGTWTYNNDYYYDEDGELINFGKELEDDELEDDELEDDELNDNLYLGLNFISEEGEWLDDDELED